HPLPNQRPPWAADRDRGSSSPLGKGAKAVTKLDERRKQYGIPATPYLPMGKNVLVFRLPDELKTAGGLYVPAAHAEVKSKGVLVAAGLAALDALSDALIEIGDLVWFGRFAGWEKEIERRDGDEGKKILAMKVEDILGSIDALNRIDSFDIRRVESDTLPAT